MADQGACLTSLETFVVWDFTSGGNLPALLDMLNREPGVQVPGKKSAHGGILRDVVLPGIVGADRVLVWVDQPNANVGFELGLAVGLGKGVALAYGTAEVPAWVRKPPLTEALVRGVTDMRGLRSLLQESRWYQLPAASPGRLGVETLCLRAPADPYDEVRMGCRPEWPQVRESYTLPEVPSLLARVGRLVWTVTEYPQGSDERDGEVNAANAVTAGWFAARCLRAQGWNSPHSGEPASLLRERLVVLRSQERDVRQVVDVLSLETCFAGVGDYEKKLDAIHRLTSQSLHGERTRGGRRTSDWRDGAACLGEIFALEPNVAASVGAKLKHIFSESGLALPAADALGAKLLAAVATHPYQVVLALNYALEELLPDDVRERPFAEILEVLLPHSVVTLDDEAGVPGRRHTTAAVTLLHVESEVARINGRRGYPLVIGERILPAHGIEVGAAEGGIEDAKELLKEVRRFLSEQLLGAAATSDDAELELELVLLMQEHAEDVRYEPQRHEREKHPRYAIDRRGDEEGEDRWRLVRDAFPLLGVVLGSSSDEKSNPAAREQRLLERRVRAILKTEMDMLV